MPGDFEFVEDFTYLLVLLLSAFQSMQVVIDADPSLRILAKY